MHVTLKIIEKLDDLLDESDEYLKCAKAHADDSELKAAYMDLARCHLEGYEKLARCCERAVERKANTASQAEGQVMREMSAWHKEKFDKRAKEIKEKMEHMR